MANAFYGKALESFLSGGIDLTTDDIKVVLVDGADYTPSTSTHQFLSSIASGARVATSGNLANKSVTLGVFDADDIVISGVTGDQFEYVVMYIDTGSDATSQLLAIWDTASGLPFTPNGSGITITWDNGSNKIFRI